MKAKLLGLGCSLAVLGWQAAKPGPVDYATEIAPILKSKCVSCHGPDVQSGGLRLDSIAAVRKGGAHGSLFTAGKGADSLIMQRILGKGGGPRMPMGFAPLTPEATAKIQAWIDQGALANEANAKHWAYIPPARPTLPVVKNKAWVRNPIDQFVLARLEKEGLKPAPDATPEQLARRVSLDLTGLPPTVAELDAFLADKKPGAYERYVDRLLASPHYGERMARIWLDLARYADTNGYEKDLPRQMWLWRDWVIGAFNQNMPYDEFTIEQLAGDELPHPTQAQLIATGFHRNSMLNDEGGIDPEEFRVVAVMDRIDATATTWLGSTLACAQCHDHKYDPFSQKDYYRFFAYFNQSEDNGRDPTPILQVPNEAQAKTLADIDAKIAADNKAMTGRTTSVLAGQAAWEKRTNESWVTPKPSEIKATGAKLTILGDNSVLASGDDPPADLYTITLPLEGKPLAGLRIEAIPHSSLPEKSSGRNFNGNFVLRRVKAKLVHADGSESPIAFADAKADFSQGDFDPRTTIRDGEGLGWAIAGFEPANRILHTLALSIEKPIDTKGGDRLVIALEHQTKYPNHNLGRFRISVTDDAELATLAPPPVLIRNLLLNPKRLPADDKQVQDFYLSQAPELKNLRDDLAQLTMKRNEVMAKVPTTMVMRDVAKPRPNHVLKRGDFRTPGDEVNPAPPTVLGGIAATSDRLGLAKWLVSPKNPLTARVEVNRLWEQCLGRGLVATAEDFGTQGDRPTHPELLDWLATEFMARKWDIKAMLKLIVTSSTYRQSSKGPAALIKDDPYNVLLARGPRFRMEAEGVRDIALVASGRLTQTIGGPSVMPPQPGGIWENSFSFYDTKERWVNDEGPNRYRRGIYTYWRRTAPFPMALTFDLKSRDMCVAHRTRTNTPLQALNTLNDPLFVECAGALGKKMAKLGGDKGLTYGFRACTSRAPKPAELAVLRKVLAEATQKFTLSPQSATDLLKEARLTAKEDLNKENAAWTVVANVLLNLDETITKG